jgi:hypothetical protein
MGEVWVISCKYANVANVAAVLTDAMSGAFDFFPALREAADGGSSKLDFFIERKNATVLAPHGLDETAPLPSRVLKQSNPFVFDLDGQAFSLPCRHGARVGWEGRAAKRAGRLDEEPERPRRIPLVV